MLRHTKIARLFILFVVVGGLFASCKRDGALENAGEKADEAIQDTKRSVEDATD